MIQFKENIQIDIRREGWTNPISQDPSSYHWASNKYNCSRLAFQSQRQKVQCWSNQKFCITVSMQKISSIHKLIQQILGPHEMIIPIFEQTHPKIIETTFGFAEFALACKKSVHSINSFLRYSQFQSPVSRLVTPISDHPTQKFHNQLLIYVNLQQHAKKSCYSIDLFWRYG